MFKILFDVLTDKEGDTNGLWFSLVGFQVITFVLGLVGTLETIHGNTDLGWTIPLLGIAILPLLCSALVFVADALIQHFMDIAFDGERPTKYFLLSKLFGNPVNKQRQYYRNNLSDWNGWNKFTYFSAFLVLNSIVFTPILILHLAFTMPLLGLSLLGVFVLIGLYYGSAFMVQKTVRLNKRLSNHVNDPNAHTKENAE